LVAANAPHESGNQSVILEGVSALPVGLTEGPTCRDMSGIDVWMSGIDKSRYVPGMSGIDVWMFGIHVWYKCMVQMPVRLV